MSTIIGLQELALLDQLIKVSSAAIQTLKEQARDDALAYFASRAGRGKRPLEWKVKDGFASATVKFRKRSAASVLTQEEVRILEADGLKLESRVVTPFYFHINGKYVNDSEMLALVRGKLSGFVPEDFIQVQEEIFCKVVTDAMLDQAFDSGASEEILGLLSIMAIKWRLNKSYDMTNFMRDVTKVLQTEPPNV
jgi:hypothetical protein